MSGQATELKLGNLSVKSDCGRAAHYVRAMWLMVQQDQPDDYVVATGETHSLLDFVQMAFRLAGLGYQKYALTDPVLYRPAKVELLIGDAAKARTNLGWSSSTSFANLVGEMLEHDCRTGGVDVFVKRSSASV